MRGTKGERKTKGEKSKNVKQEERRRTQKRAPESVPFAFIRGLRGHSALYISFCRLPFVYFFSLSRMSIFLRFRFLAFPFSVFGTALHRPARSCRLCFIIPQLFRIHATPLQSLLCHPLSSLRPSHPTPSISRGLL